MNAISNLEFKRPIWQSVAMLTLGFWLSASIILDWVVMPSLYVSGMMTQASFATAGYTIFWNFNRIELLTASLALTAVLALSKTQSNWRRSVVFLSVILVAVSLIETYFLTPQMSALGLPLNLFQAIETPANMNLLHGSYWVLEVVKLVVGGSIFNWCWKQV